MPLRVVHGGSASPDALRPRRRLWQRREALLHHRETPELQCAIFAGNETLPPIESKSAINWLQSKPLGAFCVALLIAS